MADRFGKLKIATRLLRDEGLLAVRDRVSDEAAAYRRRLPVRAREVDLLGGARRGPDPRFRVDPPVLCYLSTPPRPTLGGVQVVVRRWLDQASCRRDVALLYPERPGRYRLEVSGPEGRRAFGLLVSGDASPAALEDRGFEQAVAWSAERLGTRLLHLLGLHGVPFRSVEHIVGGGLGLVASLHDFSAFCFRPHLLERPSLRFCNYCRDLGRCDACLAHDLPVGGDDQRRRRESASRLLARADAVAFPSRFLESVHRSLFPRLETVHTEVIEPSRPSPPRGLKLREPGGRRPIRRIAFVGSARPHKGVLVFEELVERLSGSELEFLVLGGGDPVVLRRLRRLEGVQVRGYYRQGSLPSILHRRRVDLALLPSIVPESYGLTLDECRAAGVPALAFDHGALGQRIREHGGGVVVPLTSGAEGLAAAIRRFGRDGGPPAVTPPSPRSAAEEEQDWRALYGSLLAQSPSEPPNVGMRGPGAGRG